MEETTTSTEPDSEAMPRSVDESTVPTTGANDDWISYAFFGAIALVGGACFFLTGWGA